MDNGSKNAKLKSFLNVITLGKYKTNFSFKGRQDHTTFIGLVATLIIYSLILLAAIITIKDIVTYQGYDLDTRNIDEALIISSKEMTERMGL